MTGGFIETVQGTLLFDESGVILESWTRETTVNIIECCSRFDRRCSHYES